MSNMDLKSDQGDNTTDFFMKYHAIFKWVFIIIIGLAIGYHSTVKQTGVEPVMSMKDLGYSDSYVQMASSEHTWRSSNRYELGIKNYQESNESPDYAYLKMEIYDTPHTKETVYQLNQHIMKSVNDREEYVTKKNPEYDIDTAMQKVTKLDASQWNAENAYVLTPFDQQETDAYHTNCIFLAKDKRFVYLEFTHTFTMNDQRKEKLSELVTMDSSKFVAKVQ